MSKTRTFTRVPVHIEALVRAQDGTEARGTLRDLSLNGLGVLTDIVMQAGLACAIRFFLGTGSEPIPVDAHGTVVRCADGVIAVRVDSVDPDGYEHYSNLVLYNAPDAAAFERELADHADDGPAVEPTARD